MTYLKRTNPTGKKNLKITSGIVIFLAFLFLLHIIFPSFYATIFSPIAKIAWKSGSGTSRFFGRMIDITSSKLSLLEQNENLNEKIKSFETKTLLIESLQKENQELKSMLGRAESSRDILASVMSRPPVTPYDTLIIDIGSNSGVMLADKVYVNGTILIGDISEVYGNTAKVSLFSTPGRETSVLIGGRETETKAVGRGGGNYSATLPSDIVVSEGDVIKSPQIRPHVFGIVSNIEQDSSHSIQTILFKAPFNMHELRFVEVETRI